MRRTQWERRANACECCGGDAWMIANVKSPMGDHTVRVRCEMCRESCSRTKRCMEVSPFSE